MDERTSMWLAAEDAQDDTQNLVLADWLDEHGEAELAGAVRWAAEQRLRPEIDGYSRSAFWNSKKIEMSPEYSILTDKVLQGSPSVTRRCWDKNKVGYVVAFWEETEASCRYEAAFRLLKQMLENSEGDQT